ncbi:MAG TPA: hypothetical protein VHG27_00660 [Xanthobacteraceae bacterium]|nr:hypothetical protein [Xanthobacteraceae bacterium]
MLRKRVLAEHDFLTMTKLYNVRERLKEIENWERMQSLSAPSLRGSSRPFTSSLTHEQEDVGARDKRGHDREDVPAPLSENEKAIHDAGCVGVIHELHKQIDAAVAEAYGWPANLADEEILSRLVALNKERAEEEKRGLVRWLRPDYQLPRAKSRLVREEQAEALLDVPQAPAPSLPKNDPELVVALRRTLRIIGKPVEPKALAQYFREGHKATRRVERGLRLLAAAGVVGRTPSGGWFLPGERLS